MRSYRSTLAGAASVLLLVLGGCAAQPHNDVLIFGTDTKLAVDVSTPVAAGGTPEVTIGYARREAVYMPLVVNGAGGANDPQNPPFPPRLYTGTSGGPQGERTDSYSVFASFGANLRGSRNQNAPEATAGLAQFFATGIAAQHLGANSRVAEALAIQPSTSAAANANAAAAAANERAAAAERERALVARIAAEAGSDRVPGLMQEGAAAAQAERLAAAQIERCAADQPAYNAYLARVDANTATTASVKALVSRLRNTPNSEDERREAIRGQGAAASIVALQCNTGG